MRHPHGTNGFSRGPGGDLYWSGSGRSGRRSGRSDTLEHFKWPCIAKFRQLTESLKVMFSHRRVSYNPLGLQLFVRNLSVSWVSHVDVLGT